MSNRIAFEFRKSSYSGSQGECVEVACSVADMIAVRDSKDPHGPVLAFSPAAWSDFVSDVKEGTAEVCRPSIV
ncbi:DUF397 domain-containing protein [Streptomyces sp. 8N616]|uniref:DUF397 domain-containing protein n=1 Tax=Streptomyces sp. 8N616 TaxID=3457414 RepID=UPI003FCFF28F